MPKFTTFAPASQEVMVQVRIYIGVARGGHGRAIDNIYTPPAFALPSLNCALPSKPSSYLNCT